MTMIPSMEMAREVVCRVLLEHIGGKLYPPLSLTIGELHIDSLELVKVLMDVEEVIGISIDVKRLNTVVTVGDLVRLVWEHLPTTQ